MNKTEREDFENKWSEEDQRRTAIMRKMKWSDARMSKYEKYCSKHKKGASDDMFEWIGLTVVVLIWFAIWYGFKGLFDIYYNRFGMFLIIGLLYSAVWIVLLIPRLLTWFRNFYYRRALDLPIFIPSEWPKI